MNSQTHASPSFSWAELACHDGTPVPDKFRANAIIVAGRAQVLRDFLGIPLRVDSGYRTPAHNATRPGSVKDSQHLTASAMDLSDPTGSWSGIQLYQVYEGLIRAKLVPEGGLGLYDTFIHIDIRTERHRWDERTPL